jgi:hypothetical protein
VRCGRLRTKFESASRVLFKMLLKRTVYVVTQPDTTRGLSMMACVSFASEIATTLGASLQQLFNERAGHVERQTRIAMNQRAFVQHRLGPV